MPPVRKIEIYELLRRTAFPGLGLTEVSLWGLIKKTLINNTLKNIDSIKTTGTSLVAQ